MDEWAIYFNSVQFHKGIAIMVALQSAVAAAVTVAVAVAVAKDFEIFYIQIKN